MPRQAPPQIKAVLAANIRQARKELGLTQRQLAQRLDMEQMNVSRWEQPDKGGLPSMASLVALAAALECEVDWLLVNHEPEQTAA